MNVRLQRNTIPITTVALLLLFASASTLLLHGSYIVLTQIAIIVFIFFLSQSKLMSISNLWLVRYDQQPFNPATDLHRLLGREEVQIELQLVAEQMADKVVLVTGAGGSIGSEICRQVVKLKPKKLILLGHGEHSIYEITRELTKIVPSNMDLIPVIADVQDRVRIFEVFQQYRPQIIYHAAAYKHVPLMEDHPFEAVKNNIFGTKNVAEAADHFAATRFILISTDKAVNPPNMMGATKRLAEMIVQSLARESSTVFVAVRFGNVLGSRGSVVPKFLEQIANGGPVTVTHPEMTRYFMTIPESAKLVLQATIIAKGGEVFVLDMGKPQKIVDVAKLLIQLCGFRSEDIAISYTGIRPGEKLFEELLSKAEIQQEFVHPHMHIGKSSCPTTSDLTEFLNTLPFVERDDLKQTVLDMANGSWQHNKIHEQTTA